MESSMFPMSVTADGQGHLFVTDGENHCIKKFSVDGEYLGILLNEGEQGLGEPYCLKWNDATSFLVVAHKKYDGYYISVISLLWEKSFEVEGTSIFVPTDPTLSKLLNHSLKQTSTLPAVYGEIK